LFKTHDVGVLSVHLAESIAVADAASEVLEFQRFSLSG
jgi:hypothetical protein